MYIHLLQTLTTPGAQVYAMVEHLKRGTKTRYQGFLLALIDTQQEDILTDILGEDLSQESEQGGSAEVIQRTVLATQGFWIDSYITLTKAATWIGMIGAKIELSLTLLQAIP